MQTRAQTLIEILRERILNRDYPVGCHLQEVPVAEEFGLSRTPVRSALSILANEGLLEYTPKRGYRVRDFGLKEILDAYSVRAALEGLACAEAAQQGLSEEQIAVLRDALETGDRILSLGKLDPDDLDEYRLMNHTFHETIIGVSQNRWIAEFVHAAHNVPMASDRLILWDDFDIIFRSHDDHHRIFEALLERHAGRAQALMQEHVWYAGQILKRRVASPRKSDGKETLLRAGSGRRQEVVDATGPSRPFDP